MNPENFGKSLEFGETKQNLRKKKKIFVIKISKMLNCKFHDFNSLYMLFNELLNEVQKKT